MFWPDKARIAVTTSLMFEAGPQNLRRTFGPIPVAQEGDFPDLPTNSWFDYAANEGIPRALDLFDRHGVKASSFVTGMSVERYPHIAREIVKRGHEAGAHGRIWAPSFNMARDEEKTFIADGIARVERVTGQRPVGWNAHAMRTPLTLWRSCGSWTSSILLTTSAATNRSSSPAGGRDLCSPLHGASQRSAQHAPCLRPRTVRFAAEGRVRSAL